MNTEIKTCRTCKIDKSTSDFYLDKKNNYLFLDCKPCQNEKVSIKKGKRYSKIKWMDSTFKKLTEKLCTDCNTVKSINDWVKSSKTIDGLNRRCKKCHAKKAKDRTPYSELTEEKKATYREYKRNQRIGKKDFYNKKDLERYHANPQRKLAANYRTRLLTVLKRYGQEKKESSVKYLGCSMSDLFSHLESKFKIGMDWSNQGKVWHIDHIRPCASFDLTKEFEQRECFNFNNLQPLFATTEIAKDYGHMNEIGNLNKQDKLI
tara:strand:- start:42 stop:827 length:786 start_codon:yes stop_codon:yes gene_type:complete